MAKETFQQLSSEVINKAKDGTLTIGEALDFALDPRVPLPEEYNEKNKKGDYPARIRVERLKNSLSRLKKLAPESFPLGADTPLKDMRQPEIVFLFRRDGSPDMSNRAYGYQTFENIFFNALKGKRIERFFEVVDGNEEDMYPRLAGTGNPMGTQRTGLAGERPMQGTLPKSDLDAIYDKALPEILDNYGEKTARLIEYHRITFQRPEQLLGLTLNDVIVKGDTVTVKGKITTGKDHKGRPELTFKSDSPVGQLLIEAANDREGITKGKGQSLFGVNEDTFNAAFNNHIGTRLEKFSDVLPLADVKVEEGGKVVRIDQKPVTTPSAIRSIVPHYMLKMEVNRDIVQGLMGHVPNDELANNYAGVIINEELPDVLQNPEAFARTGFATTKGGQIGLQVDLLDENQKAKLADEYLSTQTAELQARTATAKTTTAEMGVREQAATIERAANMPQEVEAARIVSEGEAQIAATKAEAKQNVREGASVERGKSYRSAIRDLVLKSKPELKSAALAMLGTAASIPIVGKFAKATEMGLTAMDVAGSAETGMGVREQMMEMGFPGSVATGAGVAAGTAEFLAPVPAAEPSPDPFSIRPIDRIVSEQGSPELSQAYKEFKVPEPVQQKQGMLEASNAKERVNLATRAAEQGQETTMAQSFLYGGIVR